MSADQALPHDLLLLMVNLSQLRDEDRIVELFLDALNSRDLGITLRRVEQVADAGPDAEEIATQSSRFGFITFEGDLTVLDPDVMPVVRNGVRSLAIILENHQRARILQQEKQSLERNVEERNEIMLRTALVGFWVVDVEGSILEVNDSYCDMTGYRREELLSMSILDMEAGTSSGEVRSRMQKIRDGQGLRFETRHRARDGRFIDLEVSASYLNQDGGRCFTFFRDITARKRSDEALRESEERFRTLTRVSPVGMYRTDVNGLCLYVNKRWSEITGLSIENAQGDGWSHAIHPDDRQHVIDQWAQLTDSSTHFRDEYRFQRSDGTETWVYGQAEAVVDTYGKVSGYVGTITDITDRKLAEAAVQAQMETQKLLLSELDHRVRNNLSSLLALIDLSRSGANSIDDLANSLRSRTQAIASVHSILSGSQWQGGDLNSLVRMLAQPVMGTRVQTGGPTVMIPRGQAQAIGLIFNELAANSAKYGAMSVGGAFVQVTWSLQKNDPGERALTLRWTESGGPPIEREPVPGTGTSLIVGLTQSELGGQAELTYPRSGVAHTLRIALREQTTSRFERPGLTMAHEANRPAADPCSS